MTAMLQLYRESHEYNVLATCMATSGACYGLS